MSWDPRAERITARGAAAKASAEAAAIRAQTARQNRVADRKARSAERVERRRVAAERRAAVAAVLRRRIALVPAVPAIGSPMLIAWRRQYDFAHDVMRLGWMAPLLPVALEGGALYTSYLAYEAAASDKPAGRFRVFTWLLAGVASGINFSHGNDTQVGVASGLCSLLTPILLELTIAWRKAKATDRSAAEILRALVRRLRYPLLSIKAAAIAAARNLPAEDAWRAAWADRYGLGPDSTRRQRRVARKILDRRQKDARKAAREGALTITDLRFDSDLTSAAASASKSAPRAGSVWPLSTEGRVLLPIVAAIESASESDPQTESDSSPAPVTVWPIPLEGRRLLPITAGPQAPQTARRTATEQGEQHRSGAGRPARPNKGAKVPESARKNTEEVSPRALPDEALRERLTALIDSGELLPDASIRTVQAALGIGFNRAKRVLLSSSGQPALLGPRVDAAEPPADEGQDEEEDAA